MNKEFTVQFLDDKKFEALSLVNPRYQNTKDDLGFADMVTNRIFVRRTGVSFVDQFVTGHEIAEILAKNSAHQDEFNIRHKKVFKEIIAPYVLPVVGALLGGPAGAALGAKVGIGATMGSTIGGALGGAGASAIGAAGTGQPVKALPTLLAGAGGALTGASMAPGIQTSKAATTALGKAPSYTGQVFTGAQQALGFQSGAQQTLQKAGVGVTSTGTPFTPIGFSGGKLISPASYAPSGVQVPLNIFQQQAPAAAQTAGLGFQAPVTGTTPAQTQTLGTTTTPKIGAEAALPTGMQTAGTGAGVGAGQVATKTSMLEKLLGTNWRQTVLGASIPLLGQSIMFPPGSESVPFTPEQSQMFQETANMVRQGANVQLNPAQTQAITAQYDDALEQARQNIMDRYKMLRPGSDIATDSNMREALVELESEFAEKKANALAGAQLGLSAQQTAMMGELAAMEIYTLAMKAGISYQEAKDFKDMLGQMGFLVARGGQPVIYTGR